MWKHGFEPTSVDWGTITGFARRFYQHSTDHRGTPIRPGRVVTLVPDEGAVFGVVLGVPHDPALIDALDHREKDGYARRILSAETSAGAIEAITYVAEVGNPGFLGAEPVEQMATQIASAVGPSGRNVDYLFELAEVLRFHGVHDPHVFELERAVKELL